MNVIQVLGIDNVLFDVGDLAAAREFYLRKLGLPVAFSFPDAGILGLRLGPEEPGLLVREAAVPPAPARQTPRLWLEVADARAVAAAFREAGVEPLADPRAIATGWIVEVADPWGNVIGFADYTSRPELGRPPTVGVRRQDPRPST